jgi:hypothetical protein
MASKKTPKPGADLTDPERDRKRMKREETTINMPEVKDIPGQEHITVPRFKEMQDTTISSSDEEGEGILDDLNQPSPAENADTDSNVSPLERKLLDESANETPDEENADLRKMALDESDNEGVPLNEKGFKKDRFGEDLDVPGADQDDSDEDIGDEDEENNVYSNPD